MRVDEIMTPRPVTVGVGATAEQCALTMARHDIRHLPVVDPSKRLVGVILDGSIARRGALVGVEDLMWVPYDARDADLRAEDVMSRVEVIVPPDASVATVVRRLLDTPQDMAIVCDGDLRPVGILTEHDIIRFAQAALPDDLLAQHIMTSPAVCIDAMSDAMKAWDRMVGGGIRHVLVTEEGRLDGVVALRDLVADDVPSGRYHLAAGDVVRRRPVIRARPDTPVREIVRLMRRDRIGCVPIVDDDNVPLGVVTRTDVAQGVITTLDDSGTPTA